MTIESPTDRNDYLDSDEFGVIVTAGGGTYQGIFDNEYLEVGETMAPIESRRPMLIMRDTDITAAAITTANTILIGGITYRVHSIRPDGTGLSVLTLGLDT